MQSLPSYRELIGENRILDVGVDFERIGLAGGKKDCDDDCGRIHFMGCAWSLMGSETPGGGKRQRRSFE